MTPTALDLAHDAMAAEPENEAMALRFYGLLAASELVLVLEDEPKGEVVVPLLMETEDGPVALAFDGEARFAEFIEAPTPCLTLSGRKVAALLAGQGVLLGVNLGVSNSAALLPADAMDWLCGMALQPVDLEDRRPTRVFQPTDLPLDLLQALDARLALMAGVGTGAYLSGVEYADGSVAHLLAILDVPEAAQPDMAHAVAEALAFSGLEAGALDVTFLEAGSEAAQRLRAASLRFDIPALPEPKGRVVAAPGSDPDRPPILR